jgi:hypothetical protein
MTTIEEKEINNMFNKGLIQQIEAFEAEVKNNLNTSPEYYSYNPAEWIELDHPFTKWDFIVDHYYWVSVFAIFLSLLLIQQENPNHKHQLTESYRENNNNN